MQHKNDTGSIGNISTIPRQLTEDVAWEGRLARSLYRAPRAPLAVPDASGARFAVVSFFARHDPVALRDPVVRGVLVRGRG